MHPPCNPMQPAAFSTHAMVPNVVVHVVPPPAPIAIEIRAAERHSRAVAQLEAQTTRSLSFARSAISAAIRGSAYRGGAFVVAGFELWADSGRHRGHRHGRRVVGSSGRQVVRSDQDASAPDARSLKPEGEEHASGKKILESTRVQPLYKESLGDLRRWRVDAATQPREPHSLSRSRRCTVLTPAGRSLHCQRACVRAPSAPGLW